MFSQVFLAQTSREMATTQSKKLAYMALHFSPYGKGLSNIPSDLPKGSILLLDDSMPAENHNPEVVVNQLTEMANQFSPVAVLLDFQRPVTRDLEVMADRIVKSLPCPVGITEAYAKNLGCAVFLPPPPANQALADYLRPWEKQGVYLEIAPEALEVTVTEAGSTSVQVPLLEGLSLEDKRLHCHYNVEIFSDKVVFTICRYKEDLESMVQEAEHLGVLGCVGLYGELQYL